MARTTDRARRLRLKKLTLRALSAGETAQVRGGIHEPPNPSKAGTNSPGSTRYCLEGDL